MFNLLHSVVKIIITIKILTYTYDIQSFISKPILASLFVTFCTKKSIPLPSTKYNIMHDRYTKNVENIIIVNISQREDTTIINLITHSNIAWCN